MQVPNQHRATQWYKQKNKISKIQQENSRNPLKQQTFGGGKKVEKQMNIKT